MSAEKYHELGRIQCLAWAMGRSYHDPITNECTPDFSCCKPEMFWTNSKRRWAYYKENYGIGSEKEPNDG